MNRKSAHKYLNQVYLSTKNDSYREALSVALAALRPFSRERVEQIKGVWIFNGDWWEFRCSECHKGIGNIKKYKFCPHCGAPMTDDAVQMVMERLEALHESRNRH